LGDLLVAADEHARRPADLTALRAVCDRFARPEIRRDDQVLELVDLAVVQGPLPMGADGLIAGTRLLERLDQLLRNAVVEPAHFGPGFFLRIACDDIDANAEADLLAAPDGFRCGANLRDLTGNVLRRLRPHEIDVGVLRGDGNRWIGGAGEIDAGFACVTQRRRQTAVLEAVQVALIVERLTRGIAPERIEELARARIT